MLPNYDSSKPMMTSYEILDGFSIGGPARAEFWRAALHQTLQENTPTGFIESDMHSRIMVVVIGVKRRI